MNISMFQSFNGFHNIQQPNGTYFTVPLRYDNLLPFHVGKPLVVQAFDRINQRYVVIKKVVLPDSFTDRQGWKRAQRELYCMLSIEDENVVQTYSVFTPAKTIENMTEFYIVREFMNGTMKNLNDSTFENGESTPHITVKSIFFDICRGVQYLHTMNISHRDLKPENILMNIEGDVKLCDFGHSNVEDPNANTPYIVQRYYRAPEIICETVDNNKTNVDIWSLGCILAELLTGEVLFKGKDHIDQFVLIVQFLGNADVNFYNAMNEHARTFLKAFHLDQYFPPRNIHERFPDSLFRRALRTEPDECNLARDLLFRMLVINPDNRDNIKMVLSHPYLRDIWGEVVLPEEVPDPQPPQFLRNFFGWQTYFSPEDMKGEIFNKIKEFEAQYSIFTGSRH